MPAKVDTSSAFAITGLDVSAPSGNNGEPEIDLEKGDQPRRHRWGYIDEGNPSNSEDEEFECLQIRDALRATCSVVFFVFFIVAAAGVMPWAIFGLIAGFIFIVNLYLAFTGVTYNSLRLGVLSIDEFYKKMDTMYAADAQLRWTIQCYHNEKTYYTMWEKDLNTGVKTSKGGGQTKKRVNTHKASMDLDYYKCNDLSIHVSPADIKEGNLYRFVITKKIKFGDEQIVKNAFVAKHKNRDKHFDLSEDFTIPSYHPTFLVTRSDKSLPFLLTPTWYIICSLSILLTIPYEVYLCSKTKGFPIEIVKEFWVYPENHQFQKATCLDDICGDQDSNEGVGQEPPTNANNTSANSSGGESHSSSGQTNNGFDDGEMRRAIALSLQENGNSQAQYM